MSVERAFLWEEKGSSQLGRAVFAVSEFPKVSAALGRGWCLRCEVSIGLSSPTEARERFSRSAGDIIPRTNT